MPRKLVQRRVSALEGWDDTYGSDEEDNENSSGGEFNWNRLLSEMVPESDEIIVGTNGVGRVWDPNEEDDEQDKEERMIAKKTMIARSIGAVEHETSVAKRWEDWSQIVGEELGETKALLRLGSMGGWNMSPNLEDENDEELVVQESSDGDKNANNDQGITSDSGGMNDGAEFESTINDWIQDYRKDSSQDMKMQIRMYALQVDIHQRSRAAEIIIKDILQKEECMADIEEQNSKEGNLLLLLFLIDFEIFNIHLSIFIDILFFLAKTTVINLLKSWQYVIKSFVQDYSHAGYACLAAIEDYVCVTMNDNVVQAFPFIVMALYDELELLDYDAIQEWTEELKELENVDDDDVNLEHKKARYKLFQTPLLQRVLEGIKSQEECSDSGSDSSGSDSDSHSGSDGDNNE